MENSPTQYGERKKPGSRVHAVHDIKEEVRTRMVMEVKIVLVLRGVGWEGSIDREGHGGVPWGAGSVLDLDLGVGHTVYLLIKLF